MISTGATLARYGVLWIPQWLIAVSAHEEKRDISSALVVARQHRIIAVNNQAFQQGLRSGMPISRIPDNSQVHVMAEHALAQERMFSQLLEIMHDHIAYCAALAPGLVVFPDSATVDTDSLSADLIGEVAYHTGLEAHIGFAPGVFAAVQASYCDLDANAIAQAIDHLPIARLAASYFPDPKKRRIMEFLQVAKLLGLQTIADIRHLDQQAFLARFGKTGQEILQIITGKDRCPPYHRTGACHVVERICDHPVQHPDHIAFLAKSVSQELAEKLAHRNVIARQLQVAITLTNGEYRERIWELAQPDIAGISQRIRWQVAAWIAQLAGEKVTDTADAVSSDSIGISVLRVGGYQLQPAGAAQESLWNERARDSQNVARTLARVRSLLGDHAVVQARYCGGRYPRDAYQIFSEDQPISNKEIASWEGELSRPWPTIMLAKAEKVSCTDLQGHECVVVAPGVLSCQAGCRDLVSFTLCYRHQNYLVTQIAGPWLHTEGWWSAERHYRRAWIQAISNRRAFLLFRENNQWWLDGIYQ